MENPWLEMSTEEEPFVCPCDEAAVGAYQEKYGERPELRLHLDLIPEPYIGDFAKCRLVILMGNPGFSEEGKDHHAKPAFRDLSIASLHRERLEYPLFLLDPRVRSSPGGQYWLKRLGEFIENVERRSDRSREEAIRLVANRVAVAELHPYHSERHALPKALEELPSSGFTAHLARRALDRGAELLVARGFRRWEQKLGSLPEYTLVPRSPQAGGAIRATSLYRASQVDELPRLVD